MTQTSDKVLQPSTCFESTTSHNTIDSNTSHPTPTPHPVLYPTRFFRKFTFFCDSPGGVAVSAANGRIVCDNTLSSRLTVIYQELLPKIRGLLFPAF